MSPHVEQVALLQPAEEFGVERQGPQAEVHLIGHAVVGGLPEEGGEGRSRHRADAVQRAAPVVFDDAGPKQVSHTGGGSQAHPTHPNLASST